MSEWKDCVLANVCHYVKDRRPTDGLTVDNYISTENLLPNKGGYTTASSVPEGVQVTDFCKGDVLVSNIRPYFKKIWQATFDSGCSNDVLVFRAEDGVDPRWLNYVLANDRFFDHCMAGAKGCKMPRGDKQQIMEYPVNLPDLPTQRKIAAVLGALDDKIELNRKMNANLEAMAQALFKSWFVDFEPFGGAMPEGWRESNLLEIADYVNGLAMQKFRPAEGDVGLPVLKIVELRQGVCDAASERCKSDIDLAYVAEDGDVIFSWSGSLLVDFWCGGRAGVNQHLFKVTSKKYDKWFYYAWTKHHLARFVKVAADMATTMGHIKRGELAEAKVLIPSNDDYQRLGKLLDPIYARMIDCRLQSRTLAKLRDALLPKLMSGELDIDEVKID